MRGKSKHDRASTDVKVLLLAGVGILTFVVYAAIKAFINALWNNPDTGVETFRHVTHGLGEFVGSLSAGALFIIVLGLMVLGRLLE